MPAGVRKRGETRRSPPMRLIVLLVVTVTLGHRRAGYNRWRENPLSSIRPLLHVCEVLLTAYPSGVLLKDA